MIRLSALFLAVSCVSPDVPLASAEIARVDSLPFFDSPDFTPRWHAEAPADFHAIPAFSLTDQHGTEITEADMDGKIAVVDFFFATCGGICPRLAESMAELDATLPADADVVLLSYSVMPEHDTVPVLAEYAESRGVTSDRWHFLTGDRAAIYDLGREAYFIEEDLGEDKDPDDFLHTENVVLLDGNRRIRGVYNGLNRASMAQLTADAHTLLDARLDRQP